MLYIFLSVLVLLVVWMVITDPLVVSKVETFWSKLEQYWTTFQNFSNTKRRIVLAILIVLLFAIIVYIYTQR